MVMVALCISSVSLTTSSHGAPLFHLLSIHLSLLLVILYSVSATVVGLLLFFLWLISFFLSLSLSNRLFDVPLVAFFLASL
jgi:hypothetical protein